MRTLRPVLICPKNSPSQLCPAAVPVDIHKTNIDWLADAMVDSWQQSQCDSVYSFDRGVDEDGSVDS